MSIKCSVEAKEEGPLWFLDQLPLTVQRVRAMFQPCASLVGKRRDLG